MRYRIGTILNEEENRVNVYRMVNGDSLTDAVMEISFDAKVEVPEDKGLYPENYVFAFYTNICFKDEAGKKIPNMPEKEIKRISPIFKDEKESVSLTHLRSEFSDIMNFMKVPMTRKSLGSQIFYDILGFINFDDSEAWEELDSDKEELANGIWIPLMHSVHKARKAVKL